MTVEDAWQHRGVGKRLTKRLAAAGRRPRATSRSWRRCCPTTGPRSGSSASSSPTRRALGRRRVRSRRCRSCTRADRRVARRTSARRARVSATCRCAPGDRRAGTRSASPDHVSSTAHTLLSTRPCASPSSRTMPSRRSVATHAVRFGHAIHRPPAGAIARASVSKRRSSSARTRREEEHDVLLRRALACAAAHRRATDRARARSPSGARTSATRAPGLMPSFWGRGVPEYPATRSQSIAVEPCGQSGRIADAPAREPRHRRRDHADARRGTAIRRTRPRPSGVKIAATTPPSKSPRRGPPATTKMLNDDDPTAQVRRER